MMIFSLVSSIHINLFKLNRCTIEIGAKVYMYTIYSTISSHIEKVNFNHAAIKPPYKEDNPLSLISNTYISSLYIRTHRHALN